MSDLSALSSVSTRSSTRRGIDTHPSIDVFSKASVVGKYRGKRADTVVMGAKMTVNGS